jgi:hypothetical protein
MKVRWYAHLPGVVLEESEKVTIGLGQLVYLPWSEWRQLDDAFPFGDREYERSRPVFYTGEASLPEDIDSALDQVRDWVRLLHLAFLLHPETPLLPAPQMSVTYVVIQPLGDTAVNTRVRRFIGPFEREWVIYGGGRIKYEFDDTKLAGVRQAYKFLADFDSNNAFSGVEAGLSTLELTARPDFYSNARLSNSMWVVTPINEFVHCMAALEHILLPAKDEAPAAMRLTPTFGQHAAVLTAGASRDDMQEESETISALYRLRSRLVHGEIGISDLGDEEWWYVDEARPLLRYVIIAAMALGQTKMGEESLSLLLAQAYKNTDAHHSLFQRLEEINTR